MIFNSTPFFLFFAVVFFFYYLFSNEKAQNIILLIASYFFYGYADWKMLALLFVSTTVFYFLGLKIGKSNDDNNEIKATIYKIVGVVLGIGLLIFFKYLNFFIESFASFFSLLGLKINWHTFNIIVPLGISFFTFRLLSYILEVYRESMEPTKDYLKFATYVSFFPSILSGPIDRPNVFIPQLEKSRKFDYDLAVDGCRQILWGAFKKIVIADNCAVFVNTIWANVPNMTGSDLLMAAIMYLFQLYADFSGYSDMAIGIGKLFGIQVAENFKFPLFAVNISDFWRRWHISLTSWLTDYVFMPLNFAFRKYGKFGIIMAIIINFVLVGFWHGADWKYGLYGLYHGLLFVPLILTGDFQKKQNIHINKLGLPVWKDLFRIFLTMILVCIGLIIFRADSVSLFGTYLGGMAQFGTIRALYRLFIDPRICIFTWMTVVMLIVEWINRNKRHGLDLMLNSHALKFTIYTAIAFAIFVFSGEAEEFVYFQF